MQTVDPLEEKILRRIPLETLAVAAVFALPAAFVFDPLTAGFILAGGAISALGFIWLKSSLTRFLLKSGKKALRSGLLFYALRLVLILAVFFIIILFFPRKIIAFAAGFSAVVPVFLIEGVKAFISAKQWKS
jgi:hypothetical protein